MHSHFWKFYHYQIPVPSALQILDKFLTDKKMRLVDLFRSADRNQDWRLTKDELLAAVEKVRIICMSLYCTIFRIGLFTGIQATCLSEVKAAARTALASPIKCVTWLVFTCHHKMGYIYWFCIDSQENHPLFDFQLLGDQKCCADSCQCAQPLCVYAHARMIVYTW